MNSPSFFDKIKAFFVFIWNFLRNLIKGRANINVEHAEKVIIYVPNVSAGRDIKDVVITLKPTDWTKNAESAESIVPTVISLPKSSSLNEQTILVYKSIMRSLEKASAVLDPVIAQALYLCCTHKVAVLAKNDDMAKFVEDKLEKISTFRPQAGYIPPDIKHWYERFVEIDLRGNLSGVVIPVLEIASEKLQIHPSESKEVMKECRRFIRWLYTSMLKPEEQQRYCFKGKYLNIGLVFIAEFDWVSYFTIAMSLLEQECDPVILLAYGSDYTIKSTNIACFLEKLEKREFGSSRIILTPRFESYNAEPFLASYFFMHPHFAEGKNKLTEDWQRWQTKSPNRIKILDKEWGFSQISNLILNGKSVIVEHDWNTLKQFLDACFRVIIQTSAKIASHRIEMRTDGGPTRDKFWASLSFVLSPSRAW